MQQHYGIDLGDRELLRARSWRWLRVRITGLLQIESRLSRALAPRRSISAKGAADGARGPVRSRPSDAMAFGNE